jgi:hypothetical protein
MTEEKSEKSNQWNLTVVALVALVAIVGLVALVMNASGGARERTALDTAKLAADGETARDAVGSAYIRSQAAFMSRPQIAQPAGNTSVCVPDCFCDSRRGENTASCPQDCTAVGRYQTGCDAPGATPTQNKTYPMFRCAPGNGCGAGYYCDMRYGSSGICLPL